MVVVEVDNGLYRDTHMDIQKPRRTRKVRTIAKVKRKSAGAKTRLALIIKGTRAALLVGGCVQRRIANGPTPQIYCVLAVADVVETVATDLEIRNPRHSPSRIVSARQHDMSAQPEGAAEGETKGV